MTNLWIPLISVTPRCSRPSRHRPPYPRRLWWRRHWPGCCSTSRSPAPRRRGTPLRARRRSNTAASPRRGAAARPSAPWAPPCSSLPAATPYAADSSPPLLLHPCGPRSRCSLAGSTKKANPWKSQTETNSKGWQGRGGWESRRPAVVDRQQIGMSARSRGGDLVRSSVRGENRDLREALKSLAGGTERYMVQRTSMPAASRNRWTTGSVATRSKASSDVVRMAGEVRWPLVPQLSAAPKAAGIRNAQPYNGRITAPSSRTSARARLRIWSLNSPAWPIPQTRENSNTNTFLSETQHTRPEWKRRRHQARG
jgi:hypothetical protein